jgi:hypothetical protein
MKVTLETQRGIGAGVTPPLIVDAALLSPEDAADLTRLVAAAKAEKPSQHGGQEKIQIVDTNGNVLVDQQLTLTDMSPAFTALRKWVRDHAQRSNATRGKT